MIQSQLVARRVLAIEAIGEALNVDFAGLPKAIDSEHRQLFMLEKIAEILQNQEVIQFEEADGEPCYTLAEILAVEGLSKTSTKALEAALNGSSN